MNKILLILIIAIYFKVAVSRRTFTLIPPSPDHKENKLLQLPSLKSTQSSITNVKETPKTLTRIPQSSTPEKKPKATKFLRNPIFNTSVINGKVFINDKLVYTAPRSSSVNVDFEGRVFVDRKLVYDYNTDKTNIDGYQPSPTSSNSENKATGNELRYAEKGKIVEGVKGVIKINNTFYANDKDFENGYLLIHVANGNLYVNGKAILEKDPSGAVAIPDNLSISKRGVTTFKLELLDNGVLRYGDDFTTGQLFVKHDIE